MSRAAAASRRRISTRPIAPISVVSGKRDSDVAGLFEQVLPGVERHAESTTDAEAGAPAVPEPDTLVRRIDLVGDDLVAAPDGCAVSNLDKAFGCGVSKLVYQLMPVITGRSTSASNAFSTTECVPVRRDPAQLLRRFADLEPAAAGVVRRVWLAFELRLELVEMQRVLLVAGRTAGEVRRGIQRSAECVCGARTDVALIEGQSDSLVHHADDRGRGVGRIIARAWVVDDVASQAFAWGDPSGIGDRSTSPSMSCLHVHHPAVQHRLGGAGASSPTRAVRGVNSAQTTCDATDCDSAAGAAAVRTPRMDIDQEIARVRERRRGARACR